MTRRPGPPNLRPKPQPRSRPHDSRAALLRVLAELDLAGAAPDSTPADWADAIVSRFRALERAARPRPPVAPVGLELPRSDQDLAVLALAGLPPEDPMTPLLALRFLLEVYDHALGRAGGGLAPSRLAAAARLVLQLAGSPADTEE